MSSDLLARARTGIQQLENLSDEIKANTLRNVEEWLTDPQFAAYLPQLQDAITNEKWNLIVDCFYQLLPFGTGGRRGTVGMGPNRFNDYTLNNSIQGHAEYLKKQKAEKGWDSLAVVVAFDVREFHDLGGNYNPDLPNPCLGMGSREFARLAAGVYAANGITVWLQEESDPVNLATPELSFLIRHLGAQGGLNVSASHNPPDDNGAKLYNYTGGQEVPPNDEEMVQLVDQVDEVATMDFDEAVAAGLVKFATGADRKAYRDAVLAASLQPEFRDATVVYSPLHGAGKGATGRVLEEAGFNLVRVESQWDNCEGRFPNVPNQIANPEEPLAMVATAKEAARHSAEIGIATDPDADRFGAVVADGSGGYRYLDGNELAALVCHYILETRSRLGRLPAKPLVIQTEVTSKLVTRIARHFGAHCIDHLLVGFKYVGDILRAIDETGGFQGESFSPDDFLFGCEESHGALVTSSIRDKDSAGASLLIAELAAVCKAEGRSLLDYLVGVYCQFDLTRNLQLSLIMAGATGQERMAKMLRSLREDPLTELGGQKIVKTTDLRDPEGRFGPIVSETDNISRNVLLFELENGSRAAIRPSGTEPKAKVYFEGDAPLGSPGDYDRLRGDLDEALIGMARTLAQELLARAGVAPGDPSVKLAGIDQLSQKTDFDSFWRNA